MHLLAKNTKDGTETKTALSRFDLFYVMISIAGIFFAGLIVYALVEIGQENKYHFMQKCGSDLFYWVIIRFVIGIVELPLLYFFFYTWASTHVNATEVCVDIIMICLLHALFLALGVFFTYPTMENEVCKHIMIEASFTKSPLLGILGWVYMCFDAGILTSLIITAMYYYLTHRYYSTILA